MNLKATAIAPSNIAFMKYMGRKDEALRLPENASISMNLSHLLTKTTAHFSSEYEKDSLVLNGEVEKGEESRVAKHLERIRNLSGNSFFAKVVSENNFPTGTGLSSSASGFAALTVAAARAVGLQLSKKDLSILARLGSGSACRSIPDGFVLWNDGDTSEESFAESLYPSDHWDIVDIVAVVNRGRKEIATSTSHSLVSEGPYYRQRVARMPAKIEQMKELLKRKDFQAFGESLEEEARDLHVIFLSAGLIYLEPGTLEIMKRTQHWRLEGLPVYFTVNTGQDIHLLCQRKDSEALQLKLKEVPEVRDIIVNFPAKGARIVEGEDLF